MSTLPASLTTALSDRYRLEREIGAGGMATVYLAEDLRHGRQVAVKVLRPELAAVIGAERFLAEIRTTAHLQHPHILPLFDSGVADSYLFYVMPYIQGESLRDRLNHDKQLPIADAVRIATEVAGALESAHRHHVIHRDIKPENILLHDGAALIADFGIALAVSTAGNTRMTETGMSLGTPHYMSPEQAMGEREIGPQSDIYALGAVTYEMLVGEPPFTGPTAQAIVAKVVTEEPRPLTPKRHTIPAHVEAAVLTAIEKLPADRFASAAQFAAALANPGYTQAMASVTRSDAPHLAQSAALRARLALPLAAVALLAIGIAGWALTRPAPVQPVLRYGLSLPPEQAPIIERPFVIAPDGSRIAYFGPGPDGPQLWIKPRDQYQAIALAGTTAAVNPTFSPDGQWLAYVQAGQLKKMSVLGGAATTIADSVSGSTGLAWLDDRSIIYIQQGGRQLRRIPEAGGTSTVVWRSDTLFATQLAPLPGSRGILYTRCPASQCVTTQDLWVLDLKSGEERAVQSGVVRGMHIATGHVLYVRRDGGVFALPFDARRLEATGTPLPVFDSVAIVNGITPLMAVASNGTLITRSGSAITAQAIYTGVWIDRDGRETVVDSSWRFRNVVSGGNAGWRVSADGRRVVIGIATATGDDIYVKQLPRGPLSRVTLDSTPEYRPSWTPDGASVLYGSFVGGNVMRTRADGTGSPELVLDLPEGIYEFQLSPDGVWLIVRSGGTVALVGQRDIFAIRPGVDTAPIPLVANPAFDEAAFALSPDGRWLAYEGNETGRREIYVRPFPNAESGKWPISTGGGVSPIWSRKGGELYFVDANRNMMAAPLSPGSNFTFDEPRALFRLSDDIYAPANDNYTPFDIGPDGRFLMARRVESSAPAAAPLIVAENWFTELRQKLGRR